MLSEDHPKPQASRRLRVILQAAMFFLLVLAFSATATTTISAPQAMGVDRTALGSSKALIPSRTDTPTLTPIRVSTNSATPVFNTLRAAQTMPGQPQVDANTVALYHFDSASGPSAIDATGLYTGTMHGNAMVITNGLYSGALYLDGSNSYVQTPYVGTLSQQGTLEAFVDFSTACNNVSDNFALISAVGSTGADVMTLRVNPWLDFGVNINGTWQYATSGINPCKYLEAAQPGWPWPYDVWRYHHVAGTWGPNGVQIWVDGVLHGKGVPGYNANPPPDYTGPYWCNPQLQVTGTKTSGPGTPGVVNIYYPYCPPFNYGYNAVPSALTGGPSTSLSFLIGYESAMVTSQSRGYFRGNIDEIRISNIQRNFDSTVDPTSTPTPTQTPNSIAGLDIVDPYTLGLYHLDSSQPYGTIQSTYDSATLQWDGYLRDSQIVASGGRFNGGLAASGIVDSRLVMNTANVNIPTTGTFDTWINLSGTLGTPTILDGDNGASLFRLGAHQPRGNIGFGMYNASGWTWLDSNIYPYNLIGAWHHMAVTWGPRGMEIWLDGQLCVQNNYGGYPNAFVTYNVGCDMAGNCMQGMLDEVRVSNVQRTFTPVSMNGTILSGRKPVLNSTNAAPNTLIYLPLLQVVPTVPVPACAPLQ